MYIVTCMIIFKTYIIYWTDLLDCLTEYIGILAQSAILQMHVIYIILFREACTIF